jgi:hypothetical protein
MKNEKFIASFEVLIVHLLKIQVSWVVTLIVKIMPDFPWTVCHHHLGQVVQEEQVYGKVMSYTGMVDVGSG